MMEPSLEQLTRDPHRVWAALRQTRPVAWVEALGGWVVLTRRMCVEVMRDAATFTVDDPRFSTAQVVGPSMLSLDGSEHLRHRGPFVDGLRPAALEANLLPALKTLAVDTWSAAGPEVEARTAVARPVAAQAMGLVLGLEGESDRLPGWYESIVGAVDTVSRGGEVPQTALQAVEELATATGTPGFLGPHRLNSREVAANLAVFLFGGVETGEGMIANAIFHLLSNPPAIDRVRVEPELVGRAVDESLRLEPAATRVDRYATRDVDLAGASIAKGDLVIVSLAAAGRDPEVFPEPDLFDLDRTNSHRHLAFATGPHACVGAHLARAESVAVLEAMLREVPDTRLVPERSDPPAGLVFRKPGRVTCLTGRPA